MLERSFWQENKIYFILWTAFLGVGLVIYILLPQKGDELVWLNHHQHPITDRVFIYITQLAEVQGYVVIIPLLALFRWQYFFELLILSLITIVTSFGLKNVFLMPRPKHYFGILNRLDEFHFIPTIHINAASNTSFPSGHTLSAFILFGYLAFISASRKQKLFFLLLAVLVGISRIYLMQHFLEDVLSGAFLGTIILLISYFFLCKIEWGTWAKKGLLF